jgi:hypothetical protein
MPAAKSALGGDNMGNDQDVNSNPGDLYRSSELSVDVFGTASLGGAGRNKKLRRRPARLAIRLLSGVPTPAPAGSPPALFLFAIRRREEP